MTTSISHIAFQQLLPENKMYQNLITLLLLSCLCVQCSGIGFILCSNYHFYIEKNTRRLTSLEFGHGGITQCKDYGEVNRFQAFWLKLPYHCVTEVDHEGLESVMKFCPKIYKDRLISSIILDKLPKFNYKIAPGTKWCGAGNISDSVTDVGILTKLDLCCRTHDHCPDFIPVGETKYGITNDKAGTISNCECDDKFFECLHDVKHVESDNIGFLFANVLAMPCFKKDFPIVKCLEYGGQCQKYEFDPTKPQKWQLFDSKVYYSSILDNIKDAFF